MQIVLAFIGIALVIAAGIVLANLFMVRFRFASDPYGRRLINMNVRRGFFRIWIVLSAFWIAAVIVSYATSIQTALKIEDATFVAPPCKNGEQTCEPWERDWKNSGKTLPIGALIDMTGKVIMPPTDKWTLVLRICALAISLPLVTFILWFCGEWIVTGFKIKN
jgi:hypothetical protein